MAPIGALAQIGSPLLASTWQKSCLLAAAAFLGGAGSVRLYEQRACPQSPLRLHDFACLTTEHEPATAPALEQEVRALLRDAEAAGELARAGVLFQRLNDGFGFSLGDEHRFAPASLLKLPVAFAVFMLETQEPGTLALEVSYSDEQAPGCAVLSQHEASATGLELGQRYPLEQIVRASIVHSDNLAYCILIGHLNADDHRRELLRRTFRELGIQDPATLQDEAASVREYAGLLRLLYNTAYLDAASSAKLLEWLSESSYDKGIEGGVPELIRIADKFAERVTEDGTHYLHDCGIVYSGDDPYLLCVMTKGRDFAALQGVIADVSSTLYSAVAAGGR